MTAAPNPSATTSALGAGVSADGSMSVNITAYYHLFALLYLLLIRDVVFRVKLCGTQNKRLGEHQQSAAGSAGGAKESTS